MIENSIKKKIQVLRTVSPTSLKLTLHQLQLGSTYSLGECLQMEYQLVHRIMKHKDFHEGDFHEEHKDFHKYKLIASIQLCAF